MKIKLYKHEEMLFALLRSSLTQNAADVSVFEGATPEEWRKCYLLAEQQGVKALAWDGVVTLPSEKRPSKQLYLNWALAVEKYEKQYEHYCRTIAKLTDFFAQHGILTMQMKGVGFSTYYPHPEHREGGDIDIYTRSADTSVMSDEEANALADRLIQEQGIEVERTTPKHSIFYYDGIPVENHKCYLNTYCMEKAISVEKVLKTLDKPERESLLNGECSIYVPSNAFNSIFISYHTMQHVSEGLSLHQICDWACLLNKHGIDIPDEIDDKNFNKSISIFNTFALRFLGSSEAPTVCSEEELDLFYRFLMRVREDGDILSKNPFVVLSIKYTRFFRRLKLLNIMLGEAILPKILNSIYLHIVRPSNIFARKTYFKD